MAKPGESSGPLQVKITQTMLDPEQYGLNAVESQRSKKDVTKVGSKKAWFFAKKRSDHLADDRMDSGGFKNCCRHHRKNQLTGPS